MNKPEIGDEMWDVREHLYYEAGVAAPLLEYVVCAVRVKEYFKGRYVFIDVTDGKTPRRYKLSEIGTRVFNTAREAALFAQQLSDHTDAVWMRMGSPPVRGTWEKYLKEDHE